MSSAEKKSTSRQAPRRSASSNSAIEAEAKIHPSSEPAS